jgi:hypothetical protein
MTDPETLARLRAVPERTAPSLAGMSQRFTVVIGGLNAARTMRSLSPTANDIAPDPERPTPPRARPHTESTFAATLAAFEAPAPARAAPVADEEPANATDRLAELAARLRSMRAAT